MSDISFRERQALSLGATLYVPANHHDLLQIVSTHKTGARSLIICTEDALADEHLEDGLKSIERCLPSVMTLSQHETQVFIRPRNPAVLQRLLDMDGIERAAGFVLPKFETTNIEEWASVMTKADPGLGIMPTLETAETFCMETMRSMVHLLQKGSLASRVIALRIGGNDLLHSLSIRRPRGMTIYETPLGSLISQLTGIFKPHGFYLTAPVYEHFSDIHGLITELARDKAHGLVGKTAIHPSQIDVIERYLMPSEDDIAEAKAILDEGAKAVFQMNGSMCEVATHRHWAARVLFLSGRKTITPKLRTVA